MIIPNVAILELTPRCNHCCLFCYCPWEYDKDYTNTELSTAEWCDIIKAYANNGVKQVTFTGGEPLMRDDLLKLVGFADKQDLRVGVITNGRLVDDIFLNELVKYNAQLSVSVPGINTFKEHTGVDNVEHVLEIFKKCKEIGLRSIANVTVTKKNLPELFENLSLPLINGAEYILLNRFMPGGRGMFNKEFLLSNDEINEALDIAEEVLSLSGKSGHVGTELPYCIIKDYKKYKNLHISTTCGAVNTFFVTDPEGYIKPCNHSPERICRWNELDKLKDSVTWNRYLTRDYIPEMCKGCANLCRCDGGCREAARVNHGNINDNDPCFEKLQKNRSYGIL